MKKIILILIVLTSTNLLAGEPTPNKEPEQYGPCKEIKEACDHAGFAKDKAKEGYGLWVDCIEPIMKGTPQPSKAVKPLPSVSAGVVQACLAKHPNYGEGHHHKNQKM